VVAEQHDPEAALLVTEKRLPRALGIDAGALRHERLLDDVGRPSGEPECREQTERDRAAVRQVVAGRRLERVGERVAEVEDVTWPVVVGIAKADSRLERRAA